MRSQLVLAAAAAALLASCQCNRPPPKDPVLPEGSPCAEDIACETGFCESVLGKPKVCIRKCTTGCKALEVCETLQPDRLGCVPELAGLCKTCSADTDCPYPGDKCIVLGGAQFCGRDCAYDAMGCPSSFRCSDAVGLTGETVKAQCQPESGTCACIATTVGQTMPCEAMNVNGRCIGVKVCEPPKGYGQCSAKTPAAEICNGEDDNCNGQIDENLGDLTCGQGECMKKTAACANGLPQTCVPGTPGAEVCDGKDNDCDGVVDDGYDLQTDVGNCGTCGFACVVTNAVPACVGAKCGILHCLPGWSDRDGVAANGCEFQCTPIDGGNGGAEVCDGIDNDCNGIIDDGFNLVSDPTNCGQCGLVCNVANGTVSTYACVARICSIATCQPGKGNCNQVYVDGCETNTATDLAHCGACGAACNPAHATGSCTNGTCGIASCAPGYSNCNTLLPDGCEVNTAADPQNCGSCGTVCNFPNATSTCTAGTCGLTCLANWWNVDNNQSNGCEYACVKTNNGVEKCDGVDNNCDGVIDEGFPVTSDPLNCGACGAACQAAFAQTLSCTNSVCGIVSCQSGHGNCNGQYVDGCETNTNTSLSHCGACNALCSAANASPVCNNGTCTVGTCNPGFRDCNGLLSDGCEINSTTNAAHCGACNNNCVLPFATPVCSGGSCQVGACTPGHWNIDGLAANGCEYACIATGFETCDGVDNDCNGVVDDGFNLATDPLHCGSCTNACSATQASTYRCVTGSCGVLTCNAGYSDCDGLYANGCEVNTNTSLTSCGTCGAACTTPNATPVCNTGTCAIQSCNPGFRNCNGTVSDGCEINSNSDPANCGGCGTQCSFPGANASCTNGLCGFTCQTNRWNLDGDSSNGCEYSCVYQSAIDIPDVAFVDANCDGIDGEVNNAIFVSPTGNDGAAGTRLAPKATINGGLAAAAANNKRDVYVAAGSYPSVSLVANKGVFGAYSSTNWARSNANVVTASGNPALIANNASNSTVQLLNFIGANATGNSGTSYAGMFVNSANVSLQNVALRAGSGSNGVAGVAGSNGASGSNGFSGEAGCEESGSIFCGNCGRPLGGAGGTSACGRTGGTGGQPGRLNNSGDTGGTGAGGTLGGPGTPPGNGNWATPGYYWGATGADGSAGSNGASASNFGSTALGGYIVAVAFGGGWGVDGNGGGGGGGGGGGNDNCASYGGGGGGGGAGGCGAGPGTPGTSGGAAIALYLWNSSVSSTGCTYQTGNGGVGGNGGSGGGGGAPGAGAPINSYGGGGEQDDGSNGGGGGWGGWGGNGGWGGAGAGGPAIGVLRAGGSAFTEASTTWSVGNGGLGGFSGSGNGATGYKINLY